MKKVVTALFVLAMVTAANAALKISVNGVVDPPDSQIAMKPSEWATIDVWSDGQTPGNASFYLKVEGLASYDITQAINQVNRPGYPDTIFEIEPGLIFMDLAIPIPEVPPVPPGIVIDKIRIHCDGYPGDVLLTLSGEYNTGIEVFDTQIIHQIPEPMTLALLGLGGLLLRRRK